MTNETVVQRETFQVSEMAENLIGSEIIKIATEVREKIKKGNHIYNYTIGDFDPHIFPIPSELRDEIIKALIAGATNYPEANGLVELRNEVSAFLEERQGLKYSPDEVVISCGARPLIYAIYRTLVDSGDKVIFPVPSWNNNHYCHMSGAETVEIPTKAEFNFMPTAAELKPHLKNTTLIALCSPLNPTGTTFGKEQLEEICDLILEENARRGDSESPLYLMYDQIYWVLTYGNTKHHDPVSLRPEMRNYTVFVDGLSKCFAATGLRVGWSVGPRHITDRMPAILSHVGAWAPKAEQLATANFLANKTAVDAFLNNFKSEVSERLNALYEGFLNLKNDGFRVNVIAPQAAIYLTVQFDLAGSQTSNGVVLKNARDITKFLLDEAHLAVVPFYAFGSDDNNNWFRISVGTCDKKEIPDLLNRLKQALYSLKS